MSDVIKSIERLRREADRLDTLAVKARDRADKAKQRLVEVQEALTRELPPARRPRATKPVPSQALDLVGEESLTLS